MANSEIRNPKSKINISLLSAGAGSGKTYTLTGKMTDLLWQGVRASGIIATTFTKKAAAELQERVRVRLLEAGLTEAANDLGSALIGTVHSIGVRLLQRFAFEAGVSPLVEIIADGDEQRLFNESLSQVLTEKRIETLNRLAERLGMTKSSFGEEYDWRRDIRLLTDVARANNFSTEVLKKSKRLSWETFQRFLPPTAETDAQTWNNQLLAQLENTAAALESNPADETKKTRDTAIELRKFANQIRFREELHWHEWVKISKLEPGSKSKDLFQDLKDFAASHERHKLFQEDIKNFIFMMFDVAIAALEEFENYKKKRGLIDYTDMEAYVSQLLKNETVQETLRNELDLLLVDEFQDTSPIQLDIFLKISRLAKHSIWVGDPKQSIYGFRGAEPALMKAIVEATGGIRPENILPKSWRSREDIVNATNAIFVKAFPEFPKEQVALEPVRKDAGFDPGSETQKPKPEIRNALIHWHFRSELDEKKVPGAPWLENCIADQISILLEQGLAVQPKGSKAWRNVQPGDIAVLCRSNFACTSMAEALHRAGLKASIARAGLLDTREAKLVLACLKFLLSPSDALSIAEIRLLASGEDLEKIVNDRLHFLEKNRGGDSAQPFDNQSNRWSLESPVIQKLLEIRPRVADLSASEILGLLLDELDLRRTVITFGNAPQRLDNLDMLRRFAADYEDACNRLHSAASLGGFLLWLTNLEDEKMDLQGSGESPDAVKVLTYHKSKGLEYPVTVCHNLNQELREKIWGINLVSESETVDLDDILGNRWLRFWVNPYADQLRNTRLDDALRQSPEWAVASAAAFAEEARLLYVGLTRARDYLIFPTTAKPTKWLNRVFNNGDESIKALDENSDETPFYWNGEVIKIATEFLYKPKDFAEADRAEPPVRFHADRAGKRFHQSSKIDLLAETPPGFDPKIGEPETFAAPPASFQEISDENAPALHKALQSVFWADNLRYPIDERLVMISNQLKIRQLQETEIAPPEISRLTESFFLFLKNRFSPKKMERKMPFSTTFNERQIEFEIDFLLENEGSVFALQVAPFSSGKRNARQQAANFAPFFGWARLAFRQFFPGKEVRFFLLFPGEGLVCEVWV